MVTIAGGWGLPLLPALQPVGGLGADDGVQGEAAGRGLPQSLSPLQPLGGQVAGVGAEMEEAGGGWWLQLDPLANGSIHGWTGFRS